MSRAIGFAELLLVGIGIGGSAVQAFVYKMSLETAAANAQRAALPPDELATRMGHGAAMTESEAVDAGRSLMTTADQPEKD
jgi:hypothetical protein